MDFPRDNHLKKKGAPTSQPIHQKQWGQQSNPGSFGPNKGKIAI